jgi:glycosyltransferase involved in cell wall biosynthesis
LLVPPRDAAALAAALRRLIDSPDTARVMGDEARRVARDRFDATTQSRRLEEILYEVIAGRR